MLLHGASSNSTRWSEFVEHTRLAAEWQILRPDLRGNASAALPRTRLGFDVWCDDLLALLDAERCERAVVVGHSLGANIALHFATRHPARVAALVLIEPVARPALVGSMARLAPLRPVLHALYGAARACNALGIYRRRLDSIDLRDWDRRTRNGEADLSFLGMLSLDLRTTPIAAYVRMLAATCEPWPDVRSIRVPVLALVSSRGSMTDPNLTRAALAQLPDCEIVELDAVHWIPTEQPDAMRRSIEEWLARR